MVLEKQYFFQRCGEHPIHLFIIPRQVKPHLKVSTEIMSLSIDRKGRRKDEENSNGQI